MRKLSKPSHVRAIDLSKEITEPEFVEEMLEEMHKGYMLSPLCESSNISDIAKELSPDELIDNYLKSKNNQL